jgi:hypothetical protein
MDATLDIKNRATISSSSRNVEYKKVVGIKTDNLIPTKIIIVQQWSVEKKTCPVHKNVTIRLSESKLLDFESKLDMHRIALQV